MRTKGEPKDAPNESQIIPDRRVIYIQRNITHYRELLPSHREGDIEEKGKFFRDASNKSMV